ncbi:MAG: DNA polymerase III subunit beta [bacterium]
MKLISIRENLLEGIQTIQSALSPRTTLPVLQNFLLETENSKVKIIFTDLEMAIKHYINAEVQDGGSITIPAKKFSDILHTFQSNMDIKITTDNSNKIHINSGKARFWVTGTQKDEYPVVPDINKSDSFIIRASVLAEMIKRTIFASSSEETRYVLNGLLWISGKDGFEMVATDGRRLALAKNKKSQNKKDFKIIVPTKVLYELIRFINSHEPESGEDVTVGVSTNQIGFQIRNTTFISRLVDGSFPNYEQVIPSKKDFIMEAPAGELTTITKRAALCANDRAGMVKYTLKKDVLHVSSSSQNMEFEDEMPVSYKGENFQIAFNPQFIIDVLKNIESEKITFGFTTPVNPVLIEPVGNGDFRYVVMPMRV